MFDVELAGTFLIAGIFIVSLLNLNAQVMELNTVNSLNVIAQEGINDVAIILQSEIRKIGYGMSPVSDAIRAISDSSIIFWADLDNDGAIDTVSYRIGSASEVNTTENPNDRLLYRSINGNEQDIALGLTRLEFTYFDSQGNQTATTSEIQSIGIILTYQTPFYFVDKIGSAEWAGLVFPKNLNSN